MTASTAIIGPVHEGTDAVPSLPLEQVQQFIRASKAESTVRGYQSDWRHFVEWCQARFRLQPTQNTPFARDAPIGSESGVLNTPGFADVCPLPASPETVASYIAECA